MKKRINLCTITLTILLCFGMFAGCSKGGQAGKDDQDKFSNSNSESEGTENAIPAYYADIDVQDYGVITIALDGKSAPITVENFVSLAKSGFYDGLTFHRIIKGFMMQGGDPEGTGYGGSGTQIVGEFSANGCPYNKLTHKRGVVSMARAAYSYDSASSQFFIVHQDASDSLDGQYAAFGYVTKGMEVVDAICEAARPTDNNGTIAAEEQPVIKSITIYEE